MGLIQSQEDVDVSEIGDAENAYSQHENSVRWVNTPDKRQRSWDSDSSGDYVVMAINSRRETEMKVTGARLPIEINGKHTLDRQRITDLHIHSWRTETNVGHRRRRREGASTGGRRAQGLRKQSFSAVRNHERITGDERMADRSGNQGNRRKQTVNYWKI